MGFVPRTVQPVASRYIDDAMLGPQCGQLQNVAPSKIDISSQFYNFKKFLKLFY